MRRSLTLKRAVFAAALVVGGLGFARTGSADQTDAELVAQSHKTAALYTKTDPSIGAFFRRSVGYVVFPSVAKGGLGIGGAHGVGILFEGGAAIGKVTLNQVSIGAQVGGQDFSQIIFYEVPSALAQLKAGNAQLSGQVSAVALKQGAAADAQFKNGMAVFTATKAGLMLEASVAGQKFEYRAFPAPM
jgi:lipid-binding SYLF domain-containing protein